jgi:hypothetical protein
MKTSCFKRYTGDMGVAICIYPPIDWSGLRYSPLEPDKEIFFAIKDGKISKEQYAKLYKEHTLSKLDPVEVYELFKNHVLLCYEEPGQFCHRRLVAEWLEKELNVSVPEWHPSDEIKSKSTNPLF